MILLIIRASWQPLVVRVVGQVDMSDLPLQRRWGFFVYRSRGVSCMKKEQWMPRVGRQRWVKGKGVVGVAMVFLDGMHADWRGSGRGRAEIVDMMECGINDASTKSRIRHDTCVVGNLYDGTPDDLTVRPT